MTMNARTEELLLKVWRQMHSRCANKSDSRYGGRGISVCVAWGDYGVFREWAVSAGYAEGLSIERKDNDAGYSPDNCIWADRGTQANNRRSTIRLTIFGETKSLSQWSRDPRCVVSEPALRLRISRRGWDPLKAVTTPAVKNNDQATHCPKGHEYTPDNITWDGPDKAWRKCRTCNADRARANHAKKKGSAAAG